MVDKITTFFGLLGAIGLAGTGVAIQYGMAGWVGPFALMAAIGAAGHGYFTNKGDK